MQFATTSNEKFTTKTHQSSNSNSEISKDNEGLPEYVGLEDLSKIINNLNNRAPENEPSSITCGNKLNETKLTQNQIVYMSHEALNGSETMITKKEYDSDSDIDIEYHPIYSEEVPEVLSSPEGNLQIEETEVLFNSEDDLQIEETEVLFNSKDDLQIEENEVLFNSKDDLQIEENEVLFNFEDDLQIEETEVLFNSEGDLQMDETEVLFNSEDDSQIEETEVLFNSKDDLQIEETLSNNNEKMILLECDLCSYKTTDEAYLVVHQKIHRTIVRCEFCTYVSSSEAKMSFHQRKVHSSEMQLLKEMNADYHCANCPYETKIKLEFINHCVETHKLSLPKCDLCQKSFMDEIECNAHMRSRSHKKKKEQSSCSNEDQFWNMDDSKTSSESSKSAPREFRCRLCSNAFPSSRNLFYHHRRAHAKGLGNHCCTYCDYFTSRKSNLSAHTAEIHKKTGIWNSDHCSKCSLKFFAKDVKLIHNAMVHNGTLFVCNCCEMRLFDQRERYEAHFLHHIPFKGTKIMQCLLCDNYCTGSASMLIEHYKRKHKPVKKYAIIPNPESKKNEILRMRKTEEYFAKATNFSIQQVTKIIPLKRKHKPVKKCAIIPNPESKKNEILRLKKAEEYFAHATNFTLKEVTEVIPVKEEIVEISDTDEDVL